MRLRRGPEEVTVRARTWDCPSCGQDKRRKIADMCLLASPKVMFTATFPQPHYVDPPQAGDPRDLPPLAYVGLVGEQRDSGVPPRHAKCDSQTHVYTYRDGTRRWRVMAECEHCCRYVTATLSAWRKRVRRRFGDQVDYLWAREDHPISGALHVHMAVSGLPPMSKSSRSARWMKRQWQELSGGFADVSARSSQTGGGVGWYLGKYLAKRQDQSMAKGFRRWSRTRDFAPEIRMNDPSENPRVWLAPDEPVEVMGWERVVYETGEIVVSRLRDWDPPPD